MDHPKVEFYNEIEQVEQRLADPERASSFVPRAEQPRARNGAVWGTDRATMLAKHIVFQGESDYIAQIIDTALSTATKARAL